MRRKTGTDEIPALLLEDGSAITGGADAILEHLDEHFSERSDATAHRAREREEGSTSAW